MFFLKKNKMRKKEDESLLQCLETVKHRVNQQELLMNNSIDYHNSVDYRAKAEKAKYLFLLKEARVRKARVGK
ncbi:YaaL family protein [Evansella clarkii]|jgi:hypothetical protein|uniref:YaaL family protein n=1 Tax=Evansella clarkii TaxID=79879 RepID=UPI000998C68B|nr:YaaL family protein [Evansella clarkii]